MISDTPMTDASYGIYELQKTAYNLEIKLNAANDRIKRLEEAGDAMTNCIACGCNDGGCTICRGYEDKWVKAKEAKP